MTPAPPLLTAVAALPVYALAVPLSDALVSVDLVAALW
jgi:hypothetical protein